MRRLRAPAQDKQWSQLLRQHHPEHSLQLRIHCPYTNRDPRPDGLAHSRYKCAHNDNLFHGNDQLQRYYLYCLKLVPQLRQHFLLNGSVQHIRGLQDRRINQQCGLLRLSCERITEQRQFLFEYRAQQVVLLQYSLRINY